MMDKYVRRRRKFSLSVTQYLPNILHLSVPHDCVDILAGLGQQMRFQVKFNILSILSCCRNTVFLLYAITPLCLLSQKADM